MNTTVRLPLLALLVTLLAACSSTPTWEGMSQTDISAWKGLGLDAGAAQELAEEGIGPQEAKGWMDNGITAVDDILDWKKEGFTVANSEGWVANGFDLDAATEWNEEKFTADEAKTWIDGGFDLDDAVKNRTKGLAPVE